MFFSQNAISERHESVGVDEFKTAIMSNEYILLDIRTADEYILNNIEHSKLIDYNGGNMDVVLSGLPKNQKYLVYSNKGVRSKVAMEKLKELGFSHVLELDKGIEVWK